MASQWHYARGAQFGPVSGEQLKQLAASGNLAPTDLVWKEGLPDWRPASTLKGLFPKTKPDRSGPPPLPPQVAIVPPPLPRQAPPELGSIPLEARGQKLPINPLAGGVMGLAQRAVDYARSDEARDLARKAQAKIQAGATAMREKAARAAEAGRPTNLLSDPPPAAEGFPSGVRPPLTADGTEPNGPTPGPASGLGAKAGAVGCLGVLGGLLVISFVSSLLGVGRPTTTVQDGTATVKVEVDVNSGQLFTVAHDLGTEIYRAAKGSSNVKKVIGVVWMKGDVVDGHGKPGYVDEELGRFERDADEVRKYFSEDAYMNMHINFYQAEVLMLARSNGHGLFSNWK